jgi:hypothetical protein
VSTFTTHPILELSGTRLFSLAPAVDIV